MSRLSKKDREQAEVAFFGPLIRRVLKALDNAEARARVAELEHHIKRATYPVEQHDSMVRDIEAQRDAARAEVERLREEAAIEFDRAETAAKEVERLREALRGLTEESCREHCTGGRVHRNECIEARAALAGSPVETRRALAERQREACAQYLKHWTYDEHTLSRVRATPLVTEEKP